MDKVEDGDNGEEGRIGLERGGKAGRVDGQGRRWRQW